MSEKINETKKNILHIALNLFRLKGYDNVTIKDICEESQISKHTFYYYFKSKDDLIMSFHTIPRDIHIENLNKFVNAENYFEQYWLFVSTIADFFSGLGKEITKYIFVLNVKRDIETFDQPNHKQFLEIEVDTIRKAQQLSQIRNSSDPLDLTKVGFKLIIVAVFFWSVSAEDYDLKKMARKNIEIAFDVSPELRKETK